MLNFKQDLIASTDFRHLCPECRLQKPERSKHCQTCNHCIARFDHHCEWLGKCIGAKNYKVYLAFIFSVFLNLVITFAVCLKELVFEIGPEAYVLIFDYDVLPDFL